MNTKVLITICLVFIVQSTNAGITRRDTAVSKPPDMSTIFTEGPFADILKTAQEGIATLHTRFLEIAGVENKEQLIDSVTTKAKSYATTVDGFLKTIQEELAKQSGTIDETVKGLTGKLQATVNQLKEQNPELVQATQQYKDTVSKEFEGIVQETQKLAAALQSQAGPISEQLNTAVKGIVQETAQTATQLVEKVDMAIKQKHDFPEGQGN